MTLCISFTRDLSLSNIDITDLFRLLLQLIGKTIQMFLLLLPIDPTVAIEWGDVLRNDSFPNQCIEWQNQQAREKE